ncbi:DUF2293 domain-containing protein [Mesorhizobium sp. M4B.F.Ca.ET.190.01.1.1]|nr:DUF2293 domain-containing protein [Mesorhizobium sp. M4B.F.Ca.ET.200.01.1.1]TGS17710.1 DUF2293 domain-containing protein [Mesorhizobium sp. M4B.F.Ca.ET.190.01.1.1]TGT30035.1 DUF2293 domain-containing protein [Mesorhizobium sp. M4B.F.Ca.ET.172.01.1.1]TJW01102.1 MAG: DUF2293 domain-containing protein [Mesorhizobium sp.]
MCASIIPVVPRRVATPSLLGSARRNWRGLKLGAAVGIELQKYIRHSLTDYDELLRSKMMTRDEARSFVAPQVQEVLSRWRKPGLKLRVARPAG